MRKIIQILYDHRAKAARPLFLALCDDGTVWRQVEVADPVIKPERGIMLIVDPTYHTEWERADEFELALQDDIDINNANLRPGLQHKWTPADENERGR